MAQNASWADVGQDLAKNPFRLPNLSGSSVVFESDKQKANAASAPPVAPSIPSALSAPPVPAAYTPPTYTPPTYTPPAGSEELLKTLQAALTSKASTNLTAPVYTNTVLAANPEAEAATSEWLAAIKGLKTLLGDYTKVSAKTDAGDAVALLMQQQNEKNAPMLRRAVEGAGTSAGSMQALMAGNQARDAALAGSARAADQISQYGQISGNIASSLASLAAKGDPGAQLQQALQIATMQSDATRYNTDVGAYVAELQAQTSQQNNAINALAQIYGVDQQTATQLYSTAMNAYTNWFNTTTNAGVAQQNTQADYLAQTLNTLVSGQNEQYKTQAGMYNNQQQVNATLKTKGIA